MHSNIHKSWLRRDCVFHILLNSHNFFVVDNPEMVIIVIEIIKKYAIMISEKYGLRSVELRKD